MKVEEKEVVEVKEVLEALTEAQVVALKSEIKIHKLKLKEAIASEDEEGESMLRIAIAEKTALLPEKMKMDSHSLMNSEDSLHVFAGMTKKMAEIIVAAEIEVTRSNNADKDIKEVKKLVAEVKRTDESKTRRLVNKILKGGNEKSYLPYIKEIKAVAVDLEEGNHSTQLEDLFKQIEKDFKNVSATNAPVEWNKKNLSRLFK